MGHRIGYGPPGLIIQDGEFYLWHGHLVTYLADRHQILDLALDQVQVPQDQVHCDPALWGPAEALLAGGVAVYQADGIRIQYEGVPEDESYEGVPFFQPDEWADLAAEIVALGESLAR